MREHIYRSQGVTEDQSFKLAKSVADFVLDDDTKDTVIEGVPGPFNDNLLKSLINHYRLLISRTEERIRYLNIQISRNTALLPHNHPNLYYPYQEQLNQLYQVGNILNSELAQCHKYIIDYNRFLLDLQTPFYEVLSSNSQSYYKKIKTPSRVHTEILTYLGINFTKTIDPDLQELNDKLQELNRSAQKRNGNFTFSTVPGVSFKVSQVGNDLDGLLVTGEPRRIDSLLNRFATKTSSVSAQSPTPP